MMAERRRRLKRPKTLLIFGIIFIILPILNIVSVIYQNKILFYSPALIIKSVHPVGLILIFFPIFIGFGLLLVKKWGWYLFLFYSPVFIIYNIFIIFKDTYYYNFVSLIRAIFGFTAVFFFSRKDISSPYMAIHPRGWRLQKRKPIEIDVTIDNENKKTKDICKNGFYVNWINCEKEINQEVNVNFKLNDILFDLKGGIVRIDESGVGIAFRYLSNKEKHDLKHNLQD